MFRLDGVILATPSEAVQTLSRLPPDSVMVAHAKLADQGLFLARSAVTGIERLFAFKKLRKYPVYVAYALSTESVFGPWRAQVLRYGLLTLLISLSLVPITFLTMPSPFLHDQRTFPLTH